MIAHSDSFEIVTERRRSSFTQWLSKFGGIFDMFVGVTVINVLGALIMWLFNRVVAKKSNNNDNDKQ